MFLSRNIPWTVPPDLQHSSKSRSGRHSTASILHPSRGDYDSSLRSINCQSTPYFLLGFVIGPMVISVERYASPVLHSSSIGEEDRCVNAEPWVGLQIGHQLARISHRGYSERPRKRVKRELILTFALFDPVQVGLSTAVSNSIRPSIHDSTSPNLKERTV